MENTKNYVTQLELERAHNALRIDLKKDITTVDDKVDDLRDIVLPMVESSKQTAENTRQIAVSMERFTSEQRQTNGKFYDKFNQNDVTFADIRGQFDAVGIRLSAKTEEKKMNAGLLTTVIVVCGGIITAIFQFAPTLFNQ